MSNLTREQIQAIFAKSRERQAKLREMEERKNLAESLRKKRMRETLERIEKDEQRAKERAMQASFLLEIRKEPKDSRWIEPRGINNLYSKDELEHPNENEEGRLASGYMDFINRVKNQIQNNISAKL